MIYIGGAPGSVFPAWNPATGGPGDYSNDLSSVVSYSGLLYVPGAFPDGPSENRLYLTSPNGKIAYTTDGGTSWTVEVDDDDRRYTDPAYLEFPGFTGLVLGLDTRETSDGGYYEVSADNGTRRPSGDNYNAADIEDAAIHRFFVDSTSNRLFALTYGTGLWSASYDIADPEWKWE
jgi:hypothetical protein